MPKKVQDTLNFNLTVEKTIVNDTVKVSVAINGLIDKKDDELNTEIRTRLDQVIPGATWNISNLNRRRDDTGFDRFSLTATARVEESESAKIYENAEQASRQGFKIRITEVDNSVPTSKVEECYRDMRKSLLNLARDEASDISSKEESWRVFSINFSPLSNSNYSNSNRNLRVAATVMAMSTESAVGGSEASPLGHAEKYTLIASVTLAKFA